MLTFDDRVAQMVSCIRRGEELKALMHVPATDGWKWVAPKVVTARGGRMVKEFPHHIVGFYRQDCPYDWIRDDMKQRETAVGAT